MRVRASPRLNRTEREALGGRDARIVSSTCIIRAVRQCCDAMVHDGMVSFEQARDGMLAVMAIVEAEAGELVPIGVGPKEAALRVFNRLARGDSVFDDAIDKLTKRNNFSN